MWGGISPPPPEKTKKMVDNSTDVDYNIATREFNGGYNMEWKSLGLREAIKEMLHEGKMTQKGVCEAAGYKSVGSVAQPLARGDLKVSTLLRLSDAAGFDVVLVKRNNLEGDRPIKIIGRELSKKGGDK